MSICVFVAQMRGHKRTTDTDKVRVYAIFVFSLNIRNTLSDPMLTPFSTCWS